MQQYRKKPVVITAVLFTGTNRDELVAFMGACEFDNESAYIRTLEGELKASPGDYVIKGVKGEFYPCKPDIFETTYERVEAARDTIDTSRTIYRSAVHNNAWLYTDNDEPLSEAAVEAYKSIGRIG